MTRKTAIPAVKPARSRPPNPTDLAGASFTFDTSAVQCRPPGGLLQPSGETVGTSYLRLTEEDDGEEVDEEAEGVGAVCLPVNTGFAHVVLHVVSGHWIY